MRRLLIGTGLLAAAAVTPAPQAGAAGLWGVLHGAVEWSGTVEVGGDLEIAPDAILTVAPGTLVRIAPTDATASGWDPKRVEIHVKGGLSILGTLEAPVDVRVPGLPGEPAHIRPEMPEATYAWHGIVLWPAPEGRPREVRGARFTGAFAAIQVPSGRVRVEDSCFLCCGIGVEAGSAYAPDGRCGAPGGVARPILRGCRFSRCGTGIYAEMQGAPTLERCVLEGCVTGAGNERRTGGPYPLREPGVTAIRCDFLYNVGGLLGVCVAAGNLFCHNATGLTASDYETRLLTDVEFSKWTGNVFSGNTTDVRGGDVSAAGVRVEDAGYAASYSALLEALHGEGPPLPDGLRLREDAAARGKAHDGGDPGCFAVANPTGAEVPWETLRNRLPPPLAASVDVETAAKDVVIARFRPDAGDLLRGSWWCRLPAKDDGTLRFPEGAATMALSWKVESSVAGRFDLEVAGDLQSVSLWWNGEAVEGPLAPRRFERAGSTIPVRVRSGTNWLTMRAKGRGVSGRLGVAVSFPIPSPPGASACPSPPEARLTETLLQRGKDGATWLRLAVSRPVSWTEPGTVELLDSEGSGVPSGAARLRVEEPRVLRFGPLPPAALSATSRFLVLGLRDPDGSPVGLPEVPVPFPAAPGR